MDDGTRAQATLGPCVDCGRPLPAGTLRYCVHCGAEVAEDARHRRAEARALDPWAPSASTWSTGEFRAPSPLDGVLGAVPLRPHPAPSWAGEDAPSVAEPPVAGSPVAGSPVAGSPAGPADPAPPAEPSLLARPSVPAEPGIPAPLDGWYADAWVREVPPAPASGAVPGEPVVASRPASSDDGGAPTLLVWPPIGAAPEDPGGPVNGTVNGRTGSGTPQTPASPPVPGVPGIARPFRLPDEGLEHGWSQPSPAVQAPSAPVPSSQVPSAPFRPSSIPFPPPAPLPGSAGRPEARFPGAGLPDAGFPDAGPAAEVTRDRLPVLPLVAAALVLVVVTTAGLLWFNSRDSGPVTATEVSVTASAPGPAAPSARPGSTPEAAVGTSGAAADVPPATSSDVAGGAADQDVVRALDGLLDDSAAARGDVASTAVRLQSCRVPAAEAAATFRRAGDARNKLAADASALPLSGSGDVAGLGDAVRAFIALQQASARADQSFADWADDVATEGCPGQARHTTDWELANRYSAQASAAKARFVRLWNPIAAESGLSRRSADAI